MRQKHTRLGDVNSAVGSVASDHSVRRRKQEVLVHGISDPPDKIPSKILAERDTQKMCANARGRCRPWPAYVPFMRGHDITALSGPVRMAPIKR